jgi:5,10-methylenetetrahydromethanopterin reductase
VPLLVGTWGRATRAWAGSVADELKVGGSANPDLVPVVREWLGNENVRIVLGAVSVVDEDGAWARERARAAVAPYLEVVAGLDPTVDHSAPPELARFCIAGTPEEVAARVEELWDAARIGSSSERRRAGRHGGRRADLRPRPSAARR